MALETLSLFAQQAAPKGGGGYLLLPLVLAFVVFYFVLIRGNRKQQKERQKQLDAIAKNDRVMTIGGILGTVMSVRDNEVVVKVDESNNTKLTFTKKSIQQIVTEGETPSMPNS